VNNTHHPLILFIIKKFHGSGGASPVSNGLTKSAQFVVDMLLAQGFRAKLVEAIDGNSIDALVAQNSPARVAIEALWVTPTKMAELQRLWPKVRWTVRVHSETAFLANEGIAIDWLLEYMQQGIEVAFNSQQTVDDFADIAWATSWLPNYYPQRKPRQPKPDSDTLNVGCFGALRPLKNQLEQAFAAIQFAMRHGKKLIFHMNGSRVEQSGENNLKNIKALFSNEGGLVLHPWLSHQEFLELIACMDICLQVSLSESFNIVSADAVSMGVPLVGSSAISWLPRRSRANPASAHSIADAMGRADATSVGMNREALENYLAEAVEVWTDWANN
jgi:glycosyltransferase involved in cell wall biosynthesis